MTACICDPVYHVSGLKTPFPDVDGFDPETGEHLTYEEAHDSLSSRRRSVDSVAFMRRFREETPREVNERLMRELKVGPQTRLPRPLRPCPPREIGQR